MGSSVSCRHVDQDMLGVCQDFLLKILSIELDDKLLELVDLNLSGFPFVRLQYLHLFQEIRSEFYPFFSV